MNYLFVVDHLGLGGAQRQVVELARGLKHRGHGVEILVYFPQYRFFRNSVDESQIAVHECEKGSGFSFKVIKCLRELRRNGRLDMVISYLSNPNIYAELANLTGGHGRLIVSERCSHHDDRSWLGSNARRLLHMLSDCVVTNSHTHAEWLRRKWWLRNKVACIYNGIDLTPAPPVRLLPARGADFRLLAVGRICPQKNVLGLIAALDVFYREHGYVPQVSWAGKREDGQDAQVYERRVQELLEQLPAVRARWRWLGEQPDMLRLLLEHDVLVHPAFYEGLPNVVCEALAAGMPVLVSNVCDHALLVADNERGFIFDPDDARSIADAIGRITQLSATQWRQFCTDARKYAEENLGSHKMAAAYENVSMSLAHTNR